MPPDVNGVGPRGEPPALPPRGVSRGSISRDASLNRKPTPPAVPPKRTSLTRSDLALFSADSVSTKIVVVYFDQLWKLNFGVFRHFLFSDVLFKKIK